MKVKGTFGLFLRKARRDRGMTQDELAQKLGIQKTNISNWEDGKNLPRPERIRELANALGESPKAFLQVAKWEKDLRHGIRDDVEKFFASYLMSL